MNRIKQLRKSNNMTQLELASRLYVNQTAVSQWERGVTTPSQPLLLSMCELFHCTTDYLLGVSPIGRTFVFDEPAPRGVSIPVLGSVRAGIPIEAVEDVLDYEEITPELAAKGKYFALKVKGDSMLPVICDGDVVIVRQQDDAETGDTCVVLVNGNEATVKKIKKRPEGLMLIPNNSSYEPMFYTTAETDSLPVRIVGKVVELRRTF